MLRLTQSAVARPRLWIVGVAACTAFFAAGLTRLAIRTDGAAIEPRRSAAVLATHADQAVFHDPESIVVLVSALPGGATIDTVLGADFLRALQDSLGQIPGVRPSGIQSFTTWLDLQQSFTGTGDEAFATRLAKLRTIREFSGLFLSPDGKQAALYVPLDPAAPRTRTLARLEAWLGAIPTRPYRVLLLGPAVAEMQLGDRVVHDLARLVPLVIVVIAILLGFALRCAGGVILPLLEALLVLVWTLGAMGWASVPVTLVTTILPVVLMAMAITDEIHLLDRFQTHLQSVSRDAAGRRRAILATLTEVQGPIVATTLTTGIGFLSFCSASIPPLRDFGIFTGFGIAVAMLLSFTMVPALTVLLPSRWFGVAVRPLPATAAPPFEMRLVRSPTALAVIGLALLALALPGLRLLRVQDSWIENFDPHAAIVRAEHDYNGAFWGSYRYDVVIEAQPGTFTTPEGMRLVAATARAMADGPHVGGVTSTLTPLAPIARAMGITTPIDSLSQTQLAQILAVAQMAQEESGILRFISPDGRLTRLRAHLNRADFERAQALQTDFDARLIPLLGTRHWHTSGDLPVALEVVRAIVVNQLRSAGWAIAGIVLLVFVVLRRIGLTLVTSVPVTAAALLLFGGMGWMGVRLGIATSMFASLSIGVGVDFALHVLHHYRTARQTGAAHAAALATTFERTGRAIRWNAIVLALGLLVLGVSSLRPDRTLGILLAVAVLACYGTTLLFLPKLLGWLRFSFLLALVGSAVIATPTRSRAAEGATQAVAERDFRHVDPQAERIMRDAERDFRRGARLTRMRVHTRYTAEQSGDRTLWAISDGDPKVTRVLYVFTSPEPMRGMSLLLHDPVDPQSADSTWLYLPAFESFRWLDPHNQKMLVPGTAFTPEDARGFLPFDKYSFQFQPTDGAGSRGDNDTHILAMPRNDRIRDWVGYAHLVTRVDPRRHLVVRIDYTGVDGQPLKTYEVEESVQVGPAWLPRRVRVRHLQLGFESVIESEYWVLSAKPPRSTFRPDLEPEPFLPRLEQAATRAHVTVGP